MSSQPLDPDALGQLLINLVKSARDQAVILLDPDGKVRYWNPAAHNLFGHSSEAILGRSFALLFPPEARAAGVPSRELAIAREHGVARDDRWMLRNDQTRFYASGSTTAMREGGRLIGFGKVLTDLTHEIVNRGQSEQRMRLAHQRADLLAEENRDARAELNLYELQLREQADLIDLAHDAILVRGLDGTIWLWNRGAERMYGWTAAEALGQKSHDLIKTDFSTPLEVIEKSLLQSGYWEGELRHYTRDGRQLIVESRWVPQQSNPHRVERILEINTNVTARRKAEAELERSRQVLEESFQHLLFATEAKRRFLHTVSHELRTPLNAIIGFTELLASPTKPLSADDRRSYLEQVHNAGESLLALVDEILEVSSSEGGSLQIEVKPVDLTSILTSSVNAMRAVAEQRQLQLSLRNASTSVVLADPVRLRQIMYNLLSNAIKFTPPGGKIDVTAKDRKRCVEIAVRDTGIGIAPADLQRIFDPFEKLETRAPSDGTGIGLTVTRELVEALKGSIHVRSRPGAGSTFVVRMPTGSGDICE